MEVNPSFHEQIKEKSRAHKPALIWRQFGCNLTQVDMTYRQKTFSYKELHTTLFKTNMEFRNRLYKVASIHEIALYIPHLSVNRTNGLQSRNSPLGIKVQKISAPVIISSCEIKVLMLDPNTLRVISIEMDGSGKFKRVI